MQLVLKVVLVLSLLFVPYGNAEVHESKHPERRSSKIDCFYEKAHFLPCCAAVIVCTKPAITFRILVLWLRAGFGDAQLSGLVLSAMQLIGILAGINFSFLISASRKNCYWSRSVTFGIGQNRMPCTITLGVVAGSILGGFAYSISSDDSLSVDIWRRISQNSSTKATSSLCCFELFFGHH